MRFKIVTVGWQCAEWIERTLSSLERQSAPNWDIWITYDPSDDDGARRIRDWCDARDDRWNYTINTTRQFAVRNQYEAIHALNPDDDDIVLFLDLDGDMLADRDALRRLGTYYTADTLVTYGSYRPIPTGRQMPIAPFPDSVVRDRSYRWFTLNDGCCFNHLRTMRGRVAKAIPVSACTWESGEWYQIGTDYVFMMAALELANGRYKCLTDVLLLYNHENPLSDNLVHDAAGVSCVVDCLTRPPLPPLSAAPIDQSFASMEPELRRDVLRQYGRQYGLRVFIETGTNEGKTPAALVNDFDHLYTIELHDPLWAAAVNQFRGHPQVDCLLGDSTVVLPKVLTMFDGPALVWLDGHYSGPGTAHGVESSPIREELRTLFEDGRSHVILIDDARIFGGGPEHDLYEHYRPYPELQWVKDYAAEHSYSYSLSNDIIRLLPDSLEL